MRIDDLLAELIRLREIHGNLEVGEFSDDYSDAPGEFEPPILSVVHLESDSRYRHHPIFGTSGEAVVRISD